MLLIDVGLPDGSGYDICKYAKEHREEPVIFLTTLDDEVHVDYYEDLPYILRGCIYKYILDNHKNSKRFLCAIM